MERARPAENPSATSQTSTAHFNHTGTSPNVHLTAGHLLTDQHLDFSQHRRININERSADTPVRI
ncbi:hypothetical protein EI77_02943 [Prosthecobacter fusiformis]|uniref:Uncharacterized protein n=1 Tax=Prosthecobacter fusiformis TaxID=48464 RepID=A0A4R7RUF7_9BACT|nr:hypothetical protein EI77_02943 [Prosthecobacter fusiformis]